jgi:hypothetical protein
VKAILDGYVFLCIAEERINQYAPNLARLRPESRKRYQEGQNSDSILSSSLAEGGFCSSETKHDVGRERGTKLLVSAARL